MKNHVGAQKNYSIILEIFGMVVFTFSILDKNGRERFFKESFLLADIKLDIVLGMFFLTINNININFQI